MPGLSRFAVQMVWAASVSVALGCLLGVVWFWVWEPPQGVVYDGEWFLQPSGPDFAFDATGIYVVIGSVAGLLGGVLIGQLVKRSELRVLALVLGGSFLAAWTMYVVGEAIGPGDPQVLAAHAEDLLALPAPLDFGDEVRYAPFGSTAVLALPIGAVLGLATSLLTYQPSRDSDVAHTGSMGGGLPTAGYGCRDKHGSTSGPAAPAPPTTGES